MHHKVVGLCLCLAIGFIEQPALAQFSSDLPRNASGASVTAAHDPVAGVATRIAPTQVDLAAAALSAKESGTELRTTFVPARAFDASYVPILSESKFTLLADTSTSLTRISYGVAYNPSSLRGARAIRIAQSVMTSERCGLSYANALDAIDGDEKTAKKGVNETQKRLDEAIGKWQEMVNASVGPKADPSATPPSALPAPGDLLGAIKTQREALTQAQARLEKVQRAGKKRTAETQERLKSCNDHVAVIEWGLINSGWVPQASVNVGVDIYPYGRAPDPNDATKTARLEPFGGIRLDAGLAFRPLERFSFEAWGLYRRGRSSGAAHTELATYVGGGLTVSGVVYSLLKEPEKSAEYVQTGFIPGVVVGASGQWQQCSAGKDCDKFRTESASVTPFVDVRVKAALQFRLSAPISWFSAVDKDGKDVAPTLTVASALSSL